MNTACNSVLPSMKCFNCWLLGLVKWKIPYCWNNLKIQSKNRRKRCKIYTPNPHIHDRSLSWPGTCRNFKSGGGKTSFMGPNIPSLENEVVMQVFPHVSEMQTNNFWFNITCLTLMMWCFLLKSGSLVTCHQYVVSVDGTVICK
jgi:hypothetical protein